MTQATMFPMTEEERIALLRGNLKRDAEKHLAKRDTAAAALADAQEACEGSLGLLEVFDHMVRDRARQMSHDQGGKSIIETAADIVNSGALDGDGLTVSASVVACADCVHEKKCNVRQDVGNGCGGDGFAPAGSPEPNVSVVVVLYPGQPDDPAVTEIGEHTRYGELVADYFTAAGLTDKHDVKDYRVVTEDERTDRGLAATIFHVDYGKRLLVVAADQGSVTGAEEGSE